MPMVPKSIPPIAWSSRLVITLVRGFPGSRELHRRTLRSLGLQKCCHTVIRKNTPTVGCRINQDFRRYSTCAGPLPLSQEIVAEEPIPWRLFPAKGEVFEEETQVGPHTITFETGKLARFASGAVVVGIKDTKVLATVVGGYQLEEGRGFMPLQVDYREKQYAQGKIPNNFMRREGAPKERELLVSRMIDRAIRPLFPKGYYYESQIMANVLCSDAEQDPDVVAATAASAALMVSDIPWHGPVGIVRIGRIDGRLVVNPDMDDLTQSDLNLVYACTEEKTIMIEAQGREISNNDLKEAFRLAHAEAIKLIPPQLRLATKVQNVKRSVKTFTVGKVALEKIRLKSEVAIQAVMGNSSYGKFERGKALADIQEEVEVILKKEEDIETLKVIDLGFDEVRKQIVRRNILEKEARVDGRKLDEVRDLQCETSLYVPLHGSSLFSRGNTQVLCTVTLGSPEDAQKLDSLVGPPKKRFMVHYSFPAYCINEISKSFGLNRREVGHGTLAEKSLIALLPPEEDFPYSVRVTSEVMASDGSSSMATVCGGSLALMDAGVPLRCHVAGVSIGLVTDVDEESGEIKNYRLLTDILGLEDHIGDMDFKIAGTRSGITAIQLDIKPAGIPLDIICEALEPALTARIQILERMDQEIQDPNSEMKENAPRRGYFEIQRENIGRLIGHQGSTLRNIERITGARVSISERGRVCVMAKDQASYDQAKDMVESTIGKEIELGSIHSGNVVSLKDYGAFVEIEGGHLGLLHISEISHSKVGRVSDSISVGQKVTVMCIGRDIRGNLKLSMKATQPSPSADTETDVSAGSTEISMKSEREVVVYAFPSQGHKTEEGLSKASHEKITPKDKRTSCDSNVQASDSTAQYLQEKCSASKEDDVGKEFVVTVQQMKALGAVLRMSTGELGKLFFDEKSKMSSMSTGDRCRVTCVRIDHTGRRVFEMIR